MLAGGGRERGAVNINDALCRPRVLFLRNFLLNVLRDAHAYFKTATPPPGFRVFDVARV